MVCASTHQWSCRKEILTNQYSYVEESSCSHISQERSRKEKKDGPEYLTWITPPTRSNQTLRLQTTRLLPVEKTWLQVFWSLRWVVFCCDKTDVFLWPLTATQAAKWFRRNVALRFSSFYFADPQALHVGTWPKQLHSNNLEQLTFRRTKWILITTWTRISMRACVSARELWHAVRPSSGGGHPNCGQAPGCGGAVCVQHDRAGDGWDQPCYSTGKHAFHLSRTTPSHLPSSH